jgi:hypothetical protein
MRCSNCRQPIDDDDRILSCPNCNEAICPACMFHKAVQQQACAHPKGLEPQTADSACLSCSVCLAVVQPEGRVLSCSSCDCTVCARCCEALGTAPLQQGPKKWLYGGCGHPPAILEGTMCRDDDEIMCDSCKAPIKNGSAYKFCNSCSCTVCPKCTKAVRRAAASAGTAGSGSELNRKRSGGGASSARAAAATGSGDIRQQPAGKKGARADATLPPCGVDASSRAPGVTPSSAGGTHGTAAGPFVPGRLSSGTKLEMVWVRRPLVC